MSDHAVLDDAGRFAGRLLGGPVPVLQPATTRRWWLPMVTGNLWIMIAGTVLRIHPTSFASIGVLIGSALGVAAVTEAAHAGLMTGGWRAAQRALAALFAFGAVMAFVQPTTTLVAVTSILGLLLFAQGAFYVVRAIALKKQTPYWSIGLVSGILIIQVAVWMTAGDRAWDLASRAAFVLLWLGLGAVVRGISDMTLALSLRRLASSSDAETQSSTVGQPAATPGVTGFRSALEEPAA